MKKLFTAIIISAMTILCAASASAKDMNMYINGMYSTQDIQTVGSFDMLPVEDIAGYLGFTSYYDGYTLTLYGTDRTYYFHVGDAVVTDNAGGWYGLDITPREINGKIRIPAKFFSITFGMPYTWDWVTDTLFLNSDYTYNWLINTWEYQEGKTRKRLQGWWQKSYYSEDPSYINFGADCSYFQWFDGQKAYGSYKVLSPDEIKVTYDLYSYNSRTNGYSYNGTYSDTYYTGMFYDTPHWGTGYERCYPDDELLYIMYNY